VITGRGHSKMVSVGTFWGTFQDKWCFIVLLSLVDFSAVHCQSWWSAILGEDSSQTGRGRVIVLKPCSSDFLLYTRQLRSAKKKKYIYIYIYVCVCVCVYVFIFGVSKWKLSWLVILRSLYSSHKKIMGSVIRALR
jgi:hypothetical protein